jgi:hypothetical protein
MQLRSLRPHRLREILRSTRHSDSRRVHTSEHLRGLRFPTPDRAAELVANTAQLLPTPLSLCLLLSLCLEIVLLSLCSQLVLLSLCSQLVLLSLCLGQVELPEQMPQIPDEEFWHQRPAPPEAPAELSLDTDCLSPATPFDIDDLLSPTSTQKPMAAPVRQEAPDLQLPSACTPVPLTSLDSASEAAGAESQNPSVVAPVQPPADATIEGTPAEAAGADVETPKELLQESATSTPKQSPQQQQQQSPQQQQQQSPPSARTRRRSSVVSPGTPIAESPAPVSAAEADPTDYPQQKDFGAIIAHALQQVKTGELVVSTPTTLDMSFANMSSLDMSMLTKPVLDNLSRCKTTRCLSLSVTHTLAVTGPCCCDIIKGIQDFKMCSHADSLILSLSLSASPSLSLSCCRDIIKGVQDFKMCSHADSLILSLTV